MTPERLAEIEAMERAASGPEWESYDSPEHWSLHVKGFPFQVLKAVKHDPRYAEYWPNAADGEFIVGARKAVPELIAEVKRLNAELRESLGLMDPQEETS